MIYIELVKTLTLCFWSFVIQIQNNGLWGIICIYIYCAGIVGEGVTGDLQLHKKFAQRG